MYVYLIECEGKYKIGHTNDIDKRMKDMRVGNPFPISCTHFFECDYPDNAERLLHRVFANKRINGEWFALSELDVAFIRSIVGFQDGTFTWGNMPVDAYAGTAENVRSSITFETENPLNGEPVVITEKEVFDFLQHCWRRQLNGDSYPLSRRFFTQRKRPRMTYIRYDAIMKMLDDCSVIINRRERSSGQLSLSPREIMSIVASRGTG